jgi:NAD(P)-dependent dehydrogenase (short-subunit alcohol dehydrogenase family)
MTSSFCGAQCNILYSCALQRRLANDNIRCLSLHPGVINSELMRGPITSYGFLGSLVQKLARFIAMTPFDGAKTQLYAATSPEVDEKDLK